MRTPIVTPDTASQQPDLSEESFLHHGSVTIITNDLRDEYIIQRKDNKYGVPAYSGGHSLFGGGREYGELPRDTLQREISEEIPLAAEEILDSAKEWESFPLSGTYPQQNTLRKFSFRLFVYETVLTSEWFEHVASVVSVSSNVTEGSAVRITAEELMEMAASGKDDKFIFNIGHVIRAYLDYAQCTSK